MKDINKILITGVNGFLGSYLAKKLIDEKIQVFGFVRRNSSIWRHILLGINHKITYIYGDVTDYKSVKRAITGYQPEVVINLAAIMYVQDSFDIPHTTIETNQVGVLNILEAIRTCNKEIQFVQASTSEIYGHVLLGEVPIKETNPSRPKSPYGVSKLAADHLCRIYADTYDMKVLICRSFNFSGAYQMDKLVIPSFVSRVWEYVTEGTPIDHGNLDSIRDFTHVKDTANAYYCLITDKIELTDKYDFKYNEIFNICSGPDNSIPMSGILRRIEDKILEKYSKYVKYQDFENNMNPVYVRPNDVKLLVGNGDKITQFTGWKPRYSIDDILDDVIEDIVGKKIRDLDSWRIYHE